MSDTLRGHFLIAGCRLRDPNFFKTAVLIVEHGEEGAMGLIVNRPSSITVSQALSKFIELPLNSDLVYLGGPVEPSNLFVVHDCAELDPDEPAVAPGVFMGSSAEVFRDVVCQNWPACEAFRYRVFCGCAGWGPGQLESELERGDWMVQSAQPTFVFHKNPYSVWDDLHSRSLKSHRLLPQNGDHPEWN